jgi:LPPG:FO 2-phospho-L-lactate transferase
MRDLLRRTTAPIIAVSPIIAGQALKGPAAKMMAELKVPQTATAVAEHYGDLLDGFVLDAADAGLAGAIEALGMVAHVTNTVMVSLADRTQLAEQCIAFIDRLATPGC